MDMGLIVEKTCGNCKFATKWAGRNYLPDSIVCGATGRYQIVQPHFKCSSGKFEQKASAPSLPWHKRMLKKGW